MRSIIDQNINSRTSTVKRKVDEILYPFDILIRILDVVSELTIHHIILTLDKEATSKRDKTRNFQSLRHNIIHYLESTSKKVMDAANVLAPISGASYFHRVQEIARKRKLLNDKNKSPSLLMIENVTSQNAADSIKIEKTLIK